MIYNLLMYLYFTDLKRKKQKPIDPDCCSYCYRRLKKYVPINNLLQS